jgi:hypothetical protein
MASTVQNAGRYETETLPPGLPTKLKRPEEKAIRSFKPWMVENHTIGDYLKNGWSIGICCRGCPRTIEMTPAAIEERFGAYLQMKVAALLPKLECGTEKGCGSKNMVLFPWKEKPSLAKPRPEKPQSGELF